MAADIQLAGIAPQAVYDWCNEAFPISGLGLYERHSDSGGWVHIDCRSYRARWHG
jgi:hypothetical protein